MGELRLWSLRTVSCDGEDQRATRVPIGGGRIDLLSRSEHYLGAEPVCSLELEVDETDPVPLRLRGTTEDGVPFDVELPVPDLVIQRPMSFLECEHALLLDPDPLLDTIAETRGQDGATDRIGAQVPDTLWFGSRAQAEQDHAERWLPLAPATEERDAARCRGLAADTGSGSGGGRPGGGPGCSATSPHHGGTDPGGLPLALLAGMGLVAGLCRRS